FEASLLDRLSSLGPDEHLLLQFLRAEPVCCLTGKLHESVLGACLPQDESALNALSCSGTPPTEEGSIEVFRCNVPSWTNVPWSVSLHVPSTQAMPILIHNHPMLLLSTPQCM